MKDIFSKRELNNRRLQKHSQKETTFFDLTRQALMKKKEREQYSLKYAKFNLHV